GRAVPLLFHPRLGGLNALLLDPRLGRRGELDLGGRAVGVRAGGGAWGRAGRRAAGRHRVPVDRAVAGRHRHGAAALHPRLQRVARRRSGHLLVAARARVEVAAVAVAGYRLVVVAGPVGRDRLVVGLGLVTGDGLVVAALHVAGSADRLRAGVAAGVGGRGV